MILLLEIVRAQYIRTSPRQYQYSDNISFNMIKGIGVSNRPREVFCFHLASRVNSVLLTGWRPVGGRHVETTMKHPRLLNHE